MAIDGSRPFSIDDLLQHKALELLPPESVSELERIQHLNTGGYNEAEVRANVIDPIVRILGYQKGSQFSPDLEKRIDFIDKKKFIDYKCTLWEENFWIVEAKKPAAKRKRKSFSYKDFKQALEYAVHPRINAALILLCDGELFEVFDREENVSAPILRFSKNALLDNFDKLRALLGPWRVWFFEKRRVVRLIDKVFDKELNLQRLAEFKRIIESRLTGKRSIVLTNYQRSFSAMNSANKQELFMRQASTEDIVDGWFFMSLSIGQIWAMVETLVDRCLDRPFPVLHKLFPDQPRDASDTYYAYALMFLVLLNKKAKHSEWQPGWLPGWLRNGASGKIGIEPAAHILLKRCLTQFEEDEARKVTLLCYAAVRRVLKILAVLQQKEWTKAEGFHAFMRFAGEEMSWNSFVSSPSTLILQMLNSNTIAMTARLVAGCKDGKGNLQTEVAKAKLREMWGLESALLKTAPNYRALLGQRNIGEGYPTESVDVSIDYLGHLTLGALEHFPFWKDYTLRVHREHVELLAALGSSQAREWLGNTAQISTLTEKDIADRFFFGDVGIMKELDEGYR